MLKRKAIKTCIYTLSMVSFVALAFFTKDVIKGYLFIALSLISTLLVMQQMGKPPAKPIHS